MSTPEPPRTGATPGPEQSGGDRDRTAALPVEGSGWAQNERPAAAPRTSTPRTAEPDGPDAAAPHRTVLPGGGSRAAAPGRPAPARPARSPERATSRPTGRTRKARLALKHVDPWSVFVFSLVAALFLGVALVVAVGALYTVLNALGVVTSVNDLFSEVTGGDPDSPLLSAGRIVGGAAVLAAVNVVLLTLLATLSALLYNLCASFTGGIEVTLGERDQ